jgi:hypothetical protein
MGGEKGDQHAGGEDDALLAVAAVVQPAGGRHPQVVDRPAEGGVELRFQTSRHGPAQGDALLGLGGIRLGFLEDALDLGLGEGEPGRIDRGVGLVQAPDDAEGYRPGQQDHQQDHDECFEQPG